MNEVENSDLVNPAAPPAVPVPQITAEQEQHLHLLSIFHYVIGGFGALSSLFPLLYVVMGMMVIVAPDFDSQPGLDGEMPPQVPFQVMGWFFVAIGSVGIAIGMTFSALTIFAGRKLAKRSSLVFCQVIAGLSCAFFPMGTALGVFTLIVLSKPEVARAFQESEGE